MKWFIAALLLAGCDRVFGLVDIVGATDGGSGDAEPPDERPAFCADAHVFDNMTGAQPCGWGVVYAGSMMNQHDGILEIAHPGTANTIYGCTASGPYPPLTENGVFLRVTPMMVPFGYTKLGVRNAYMTTPAAEIEIVYSTALKFFVDHVEVAAESGAVPRWWRIRQPRGTSEFVAELSDDGIAWRRWAAAPASVPSEIAVDVGVGVEPGSSTTPGNATVYAFGICK